MTVDPLAAALAAMPSANQRRRRDPWASKQAYADALMKQGASGAPVGSVWEGLARAGTGIAGGAFGGWYERQEKDAEAAKSKKLVDALQGTTSPDGVRTPATVDSITAAIGDNPDMADLAVRLKFADIMDQRARTQASEGARLMMPGAGGTRGPGPAGGAPQAGGVFDIPPQFAPQVKAAAAKYGVPEQLLAATFWNESRWNPAAVNPNDQGPGVASVGIGQWGEQWAKARGFDPKDPNASIDQTAAAMSEYAQKYGGNFMLARLAYGWGPGNVDKWLAAGGDPEKIPDGAKIWLPRTALGIADDQQARAAFPQIAGMLRPGAPGDGQPQAAPPVDNTRIAAGGPIAPQPNPTDVGSITGQSQSSVPPSLLSRLNPIQGAQAVPPSGGLPPGAPPTPMAAPPPTIPMGGPQVPLTADQIPVQPGTPSGAPLMGQPAPPAPPAALPPGLGAQLGGMAGQVIAGKAGNPVQGGFRPSTPTADVSLGPDGKLVIGGQPGPAGAPPAAPAPVAPPPAQAPVASPAAPPAGPMAAPPIPPFQPRPNPHTAELEDIRRRYDEAKARPDIQLKLADQYKAVMERAQAYDASEVARKQDYEFKQRTGNIEAEKLRLAQHTAEKPTESHAKFNIFAQRLAAAIPKLEALVRDPDGPGTLSRSLPGGLPLPFGVTIPTNSIAGPKGQMFDQVQRDIVNAILRPESGAVISESEFENARRQYIPQPNDSEQVIKQKLDNLKKELEGLTIASGPLAGKPSAQPAAPASAPPGGQLRFNPKTGKIE